MVLTFPLMVILFAQPAFAQNINENNFSEPSDDGIEPQNPYKSNPLTSKSQFHPKIQSALSSKISQNNFAVQNQITNDPFVQVVVELDSPSFEKNEQLKLFGGKVEMTYDNLVQLSLPNSAIEQIANLDFVNFVRTPNYPVQNIISEGVSVIQSNIVNSRGNTGQGIKVAVIDSGFVITDPEISGNIVETNSFRGDGNISPFGSTYHGTAVAQIIVDVAPNVELHLFNPNTDIGFFNAVDYIIGREDIDIVSMSLAWLGNGKFDGTNLYAQKVNEAKASGILWVNSAGNYAQQHWSGTFSDSDADGYHNFSVVDETINISACVGCSVIYLELTWDETWGSSSSDYDLYLYDSTITTILAHSIDTQDGNDNPAEIIYFAPTYTGTYHIVIHKFSGVTKNLELISYKHNLSEHQVTSSSIIKPADATGSLTVGATYYLNNVLESFSSRGPTNDGRTKPDISGPDGVTTSTLNPFFGTSASTPYVAGAAALVKFADPTLSPSAIQTILEETTTSNHVKNNNDGTGIVNANNAESSASPSCTPPNFGTWIITESCMMTASATAPGNVLVQNNSLLTVPSVITLDIDFSSFNLTVKSGSGVLIKSGGTIT